MAVCLGVLMWDLIERNPEVPSLMRLVWTMTVLYSGPLGLFLYWHTGRKQITRDSIWRKGWRSTAHCYSGCGMGEIIGVVITSAILSLGSTWVAVVTFVLAYIMGFSLTAGPLIQEGEPTHRALVDAFYSETASIAAMECSAIAINLWLGANTKLHEPLFWGSLVFSLTMGLFAAYPVNLLLLHYGIKEGMHDPREMARHDMAHQN